VVGGFKNVLRHSFRTCRTKDNTGARPLVINEAEAADEGAEVEGEVLRRGVRGEQQRPTRNNSRNTSSGPRRFTQRCEWQKRKKEEISSMVVKSIVEAVSAVLA
jgi:hypothetical protein